MRKTIFTCLILLNVLCSNAQIGSYNGKPHYLIYTVRAGVPIGTIEVELYPSIAPKHVRNFDSLVSLHFFDTTAFHRVIPGFVIQGGDPNSRHGPKSSWGFGDPSQVNIPAEFNAISHQRGVLSAARDNDINSANSQFFICHAAATSLDFNYTAYGKVTAGLTYVDNIVNSPRDINDGPNQKIEMFVTRGLDDSTAMSLTPLITQPADNFVGVSSEYIFKWNAVAGALLYDIEFSKDSNFQTIAIRKTSASLSIKISELEIGKVKYFWRIMANNGGYKSPPTPTRSFLTGAMAPTLISPINTSIGSSTLTNFTWSKVMDADSYRLQASFVPTFSNSSIKLDTAGIVDTNFVFNFPFANKKYYWRVASQVNGVSGGNSASMFFTTGSLVGIADNETKVSVYPNPTNEKLNFYSPEFNGVLDISIVDLLGKQVFFEKVNAVNNAFIVAFKIPTGKYFYKIISEEKVFTGSFMLQK